MTACFEKGVGFVETPLAIARLMVALARPFNRAQAAALDAGAGRGIFLKALREAGFEQIWAVECDSQLFAELYQRWSSVARLVQADFLTWDPDVRFDLIIGNPPYVHFNRLPLALQRAVQALTGYRESDLYQAFILKALRLLRPGGELIFIVPYSLMYNTYARPVRAALLREGALELIIDLDEARLFARENPETIIFRFRKNAPVPFLISLRLQERKASAAAIAEAALEALRTQSANSLFDYKELSGWSEERWGATEKALPFPTRPLSEVARIGVGAVSGCDAAFRIEHPEMLPEAERSFLRPFVKAAHCKPLRVAGHAWYALIPDGMSETELRAAAPCLYAHLLSHRSALQQRYLPAGKCWFHWQALRNLSFIEKHLNAARLFTPMLTRKTPAFAIGAGTLLPAADVLFIQPHDPRDLPWLAAYLNSPLFLSHLIAQGVRRGGRHVLTQRFLETLPVPATANAWMLHAEHLLAETQPHANLRS